MLHDFTHLKSFSVYEPHILDEFGFCEDEYEDSAAMYKNVMEDLKRPEANPDSDEEPVWDDYDLAAYSKLRIDFEDVKYEAYNFRDGELANENKLKDSADYAAYK